MEINLGNRPAAASTATASVPVIPGARPLTAVQLNAIRFNVKHTLLTPEVLEAAGKQTELQKSITRPRGVSAAEA